MLLLWNHPYEDITVKASLEYALHPKTSLSVSIEYPNLLLHFLGKLYDSNTSIHKVIRGYNGYEQKDMIPIIQDLSEYGKHGGRSSTTAGLIVFFVGTRQYFIILYITFLLENNIKKSEGHDDKQDNYYVSCLIKVIQVC